MCERETWAHQQEREEREEDCDNLKELEVVLVPLRVAEGLP